MKLRVCASSNDELRGGNIYVVFVLVGDVKVTTRLNITYWPIRIIFIYHTGRF